jgi:Holliday junction resolvase-like predicted endonuclease
MKAHRLKPREQGDIGELSAMEWLASKGAHIYLPVGHSPDIDLIAEIGGQLLRVEVKTSTCWSKGRWSVMIATRGGNQSWSGLVKHFDAKRCDHLFVHVGDGRRWLIPTGAVDGRSGVNLGGPKYSEFEIERGRPLIATSDEASLESDQPGEYRSGQTGRPVKALAQPSEVRILPPPLASAKPVEPTNYERKLGQSGQAVINQKRRITIPQRPFFEAGFENGGKVRLRSDGPGRIVVEQIELPGWARRNGHQLDLAAEGTE